MATSRSDGPLVFVQPDPTFQRDLVARLALAPTEIPIGVITAFVGVPVFLVLLRRSAGSA